MKLSIYAILSISLVLILLHIAAAFKDWNGYKGCIMKKLEKTYDAKVHIGGRVEVSLIAPKLTIYSVYIQHNGNKEQRLSNLVGVNKIEIRPSLLSLFLFSLQPKSITLFGMKSNKENLINVIKASNNVIDVIVKDSQINLNNDYGNIVNIKEVAIKKNRQFSGKVKVCDNNYDFLGTVDIAKKNVHINVGSNFVNLLFTGNRNRGELQGNLTLTIDNSSDSVSDLAKIINLGFLSHVIPSKNIKISSNINLNESGFTVTDLKIDSKSMQASGTIQNDRKSNHTNVDISFSKIDLENGSQKTTDMKDLLECFREVVPKNLSLNFNMEAANIQYQEKTLSNFRTVLKLADGEVKVDTRLTFPGINNISYLSGKVSSNNALSEFNGDLLVEGGDFESFISCFFPSIKMKESQKNQFTLNSKIHFAPRILSISDIKLLNSGEFWQGSIRMNCAKKRNVINGEFNVHDLNADKYDYSLFSGLSKVQWLKNFKYDASIKTSVDGFTLNDTKIKDLNFLLKIEQGKLIADKIVLFGEDFDIVGNIKVLVDQKYAKPLLDVNLTGNKFNGKVIVLPDLMKIKRNKKNEIDQIQWSTKQFDFLDNKQNFDADVQISAAEFKTEKNVLKDFNLDAVMRNNTLTIRQMNYDGQVFLQSHLRSDSMYTKFSIANLDTKRVIGIDNVNGQISLSGEIKARGKSFYDWANNSSGEINLQAQRIEFTNVDFNSFITNLLSSKNKSEISKLADIDIYNGSTFFENISGKASINNGICSTSLQFGIDQASGSISSNFALSNFTLISVFRFFFIPPGHGSPIYIDMHLGGPVWRPKISFDIDQIFVTLTGNRE